MPRLNVTPKLFLLDCYWRAAFTIVLACVTAQCAGQQETQAERQAQVLPGDINLEYSRVFIFVDRTTSLGHAHGIEGKLKSGQLFVGGEQPGNLVVDLTSFEADTDRARSLFGLDGAIDAGTKKKVHDNMLGGEVLDVAQFPEASLQNVSLKPTGKMSRRNLPEYLLEGDFTLQKTRRRIQAVCDLEVENGWQHVRGNFKIIQSEYGIKPFTRALGAIGVKNELLIIGDLWIVPAS